jgi:electron-transferring-flavoprotein dehydrogenase
MSEAVMIERDSMECDVVIVGAGPAGLAAAIRLKQLNAQLSVMVLEKGAEVGAHILSGAVIDPSGLDGLLPDWRSDARHPLRTPVTEDQFLLLGASTAMAIPHFLMPPLMSNKGNFVGSLADVCRWLAEVAEGMGIEIFAGFAGADLIIEEGIVRGVVTGDMGIGRDGVPGPGFTPGIELRGRYILLAEGARGSLSKQAIARFGLDTGRSPQKYGLGFKEIWEVKPEHHRPGLVQHGLGWPLDGRTGGGAYLYHLSDNKVAVGLVVHLDYANPYLSPFEEFQRLKTHKRISQTLSGGTRLSYGARALTEGGWQSVPKLDFPGGALIGCAAGFMNVPRIKGSHNAVASGKLAAEHLAEAIAAGAAPDGLSGYDAAWRTSSIGLDLLPVRNVKPLWSRLGTVLGMAVGGCDMWMTTILGGWSPFGALPHKKADWQTLRPAAEFSPITYPKPDRVLTFDRSSSVFLSNTNHAEDQPVHLRVKTPELQRRSELEIYAGPSQRYCPAGVYEWVGGEEPRYQINAQNCIHCKTCDIKDPNQNIEWVPPQGGEGPVYGSL